MFSAGIDIGSITSKVVILNDGIIYGSKVGFTGYNSEYAGTSIFNSLIDELGISADNIDYVVATGYGRNCVKFADKTFTEILCHAAGAFYINSDIRTIIDIGGQDSKVISLHPDGTIRDFVMNDKCAAGTGRFLEVIARALEIDLENFSILSLKSEKPAPISTTCTVFAESEVISLIAKGASREDIIAGVHDSVASRLSSMVYRVGMTQPVMMTGGVAKNAGLVNAIEKKLGTEIQVTDTAQINGALGAALMAEKNALKQNNEVTVC